MTFISKKGEVWKINRDKICQTENIMFMVTKKVHINEKTIKEKKIKYK
jgi:hypothetical protein